MNFLRKIVPRLILRVQKPSEFNFFLKQYADCQHLKDKTDKIA